MHVQSCCFADLDLSQPRFQGSVRESLGTRLNLLLFFFFFAVLVAVAVLVAYAPYSIM